MPRRHPVTALASIPSGSSLAFTIAGQHIAFFNVAGQIHAIADTCPHAGAPLSQGRLDGCVVTCPWHAIRFDVTTGRLPGQSDNTLATYPVFINGDQIEVEV